MAKSKFTDFESFTSGITKLRDLILENKKGAHRLNLTKDFDHYDRIKNDLFHKKELCTKIYKFEHQVFKVQNRIEGKTPLGYDLNSEMDSSSVDNFDPNKSTFVNVQDPNYRLKEYFHYMEANKENILAVREQGLTPQDSIE